MIRSELGAAIVPRAKDEQAEKAASPLWPSAGESSSGLRDKQHVGVGPSEEDAPRVGPFQLLSPVGGTAYGRAFRARRVGQDRELAVHFLSVAAQDGEESFARTLPLAAAKCARLSHPNVIAIEELGQDDESAYLVTESLDGLSLATALADEGAFTLPRALSVALQIGRALRAAHKFDIVHGALDPSNVRLKTVHGGELVRVVGFDCATFAPGSPSLAGPYQAPERVAGMRPDARGDVYALGALLYRMLAGEPPPVDASAGARPPSLASASRDPVPRALDELVARCLEPEHAARPSDLTALLRGLREIARELNLAGLDDRYTPLGASSLPPADPMPLDIDASSALFAAESTARRYGALWILLGLGVALWLVWLIWEASARGRPELGREHASEATPAHAPR